MFVDRKRSPGVRCALLALVVWLLPMTASLAADQQQQSAATVDPNDQTHVFTDEVEVNVVNLYVTVVDRNGLPVAGLTADDFVIEEGGQPLKITNFVEVGPAPAVTQSKATEVMPEPNLDVELSQPPPTTVPAQLVLVFDNASLERERRDWVLDTLSDRLNETVATVIRLMVVTLDPALEIVQPFTTNRSSIVTALDRVAAQPTQGDALKSRKRILIRDIQGVSMTGASGNPEFGAQIGRSLLGQIDALRSQEHARIEDCLVELDRLIRGVSGLPGRKDILWIGEDLLMRPALAEYRTFFTKFAGRLSLNQPGLWATRLQLNREFRYIGGVAQTASAVIHVVDASDRDRELASAGYAMRGGATGGYSVTQFHDMTEGSRYLAGTTGGTFFGSSRALAGYLDLLSELVGNYYSIGYARPGDPDGKLHPVTVRVDRKNVKVRTHERVANPTASQRLVDAAISRLLINEGPNSLELAVTLGDREPTDDDRYLQAMELEIPATSLFLSEIDGVKVGQIAIAVVAVDASGDVAPPRVLRMRVAIPNAEMTEDLMANAELRLEMKQDSVAVAVAVRDVNSGATASALASVANRRRR